MKEDIRLELFTIAELRNWLFHNVSVRGLSEKLISKTRAYAIVNNPYVTDDMNVISAIFVGDEVAAYTAVFPERLARPDKFVYWNTTLYVAPQFEGRGYGAIVIGQMCELYGDDYFDHAAAAASVQNFRFLGLPVSFVPQYILTPKAFGDTLKGKLLRHYWDVKDSIRKRKTRKRYLELANRKYVLDYVGFVDDDTYGFIERHSEGDVFLRSKEMFNWMLRYSFDIQSPLFHHVLKENVFSAYAKDSSAYACRVLVDEKLVGFYVLKAVQGQLTVKYLYYDSSNEEIVFGSLYEHIYKLEIKTVYTYNARLSDYLYDTGYFHKKLQDRVSFTYPKGFDYDPKLALQAGDGDMFT